MKFGKLAIGGCEGGGGRWCAVLHDKNSARLWAVTGIGFDNSNGFHSGLAQEGRFEIFRINVQAAGGDDDIFFAAAKVKVAFGVERGEISGGEPLRLLALHLAVLPGGVGDSFAAHQHFAIVTEADFATG